MINASAERPARFSAAIFNTVLDLFLEAKIEQQQILHESKRNWAIVLKSSMKKEFRNS
jgi:hypothetical protein